jgi:cytochrome oxidase Cu insertion factor (SCO1/SenC/PrrC family)
VSESEAVEQRRTRPAGRQPRKPIRWRAYTLVGILVLVIAIVVPVYLARVLVVPAYPTQSSGSPTAAPGAGEGAPSGIASVGNSAPAFSLQNQHGQTYTLTPADGKNHVLVFYMGYF